MDMPVKALPRVACCLRERQSNKPKTAKLQTVVRAALIGSTTATALGIAVEANTPVLVLCRYLLAAGHDPATRLDAYRGKVLSLIVRSIGEAARLEISHHGAGFIARYEGGTASPMRQIEGGGL
jgi:hypothetical protein